jgi:hypothetical protein
MELLDGEATGELGEGQYAQNLTQPMGQPRVDPGSGSGLDFAQPTGSGLGWVNLGSTHGLCHVTG